MKSLRALPVMLFAGLLAACVTINVYFPAAAAEQAADRIIQDVWGRDGPAGSAPRERQPREGQGEESGDQGGKQGGEGDRLRQPGGMGAAVMVGMLDLLVPVAQASPNIDISSPAIRQIVASMEARHTQLRPYYDSGAVGLTRNGQVEVRDQNAVPLAERNNVRKLVADDNADRQALYRQIAAANGQPEWEDDIRATFAQRWVANARSGWYYQDRSGSWVQK